ncbi:MAG: ATP-binding protein [Desulfonatronovibrio sp.]
MEDNKKTSSSREKLQILREHCVQGKELNELGRQYGVSPFKIRAWRDELFEKGDQVLSGGQEAVGSRITAPEQATDCQQRIDADVYANIVEEIPEPVMIQDLQGRYVVLNKAVTSYVGMPKEDLIGKSEAEVMDAEAATVIEAKKRMVIEREIPVEYEVNPVFATGQYTFRTTRIPYYDPAGKLVGTLGICRDVTSIKQVQRLKEDIDRITQHDLKSPLNGIISLPQILMMDSNLTAEQHELLQQIRSSGYRMLDMINMSMSLYKMEVGTYELDPQFIDVLPIIHDVFTELDSVVKANQTQTEVLSNGSPVTKDSQCMVLGEQLLCYSMLSNLIKNAVEAAEKQGKVVIELHEDAEQARINIWNTGVIPEKIQEKFGHKYATWGKKMGTGLGVYSARLIAESMNGTFAWNSTPSEGTCITVALPRVK